MPSPVTIVICQPEATGVGEPVTVKLSSRVSFLSLNKDGLNKVDWLGVTLRGQATMRASEPPTKYTAAAGC